MLLELDMRLSVMLAFSVVLGASAFVLGSCDRAVEPNGQGAQPPTLQQDAPAASAAPAANTGGDVSLTSRDGMTANLTRHYAGEAAPDAAFTGADGRKLTLAHFTGRPLLVNIWATWCAPCKHEMPALDRLAEMRAGDMSVIAISQDIKGRAPVRAFFASAGIENLEGYNDRGNRIAKALAPTLPLPATVLYDSDGREVWRVIGAVDWDGGQIAALLDEAT